MATRDYPGEEARKPVQGVSPTRVFLRTGEADKVRCGKKHFEALSVPFEVAVTAAEV